MKKKFLIREASQEDLHFAQNIVDEIASSAKIRGTGIAKRSPQYICQKMMEGKAVVAQTQEGEWAGFCYIEAWGHGHFVANSGLIVNSQFRGQGLAKEIKYATFQLSRKKFPKAKIFGLTTGAAVLKINSELGYKPVIYSELTDDQAFWKGCQSCVNYKILESKQQLACICTAMLYDPKWEDARSGAETKWSKNQLDEKQGLFKRWAQLKKSVLYKRQLKKNRNGK